MHIGILKAKNVATVFILAAVALSFIPFFMSYDYVYLFFVVIADIIFIGAVISSLELRTKLCKAAMVVALIAFYVGAVQ